MRPGPPPKPTAWRLLSGNAAHRPLKNGEPIPKLPKHLKPPIKLTKNGRKFWNRYAKPLQDLRLLSEIDVDMLAMGAVWFDIHLRAVDELANSLTQTTEANGVCARPEIAIARQAFSVVRTVLAEFGCSPAQRSRVSALPPDEEDSPAAKYLSSAKPTNSKW